VESNPNPLRATLSVVIPLYNHADVVLTAIESVLRQSRPPDEVVVVDDASTDDGAAEVERYARTHPSVRVIRSPHNQGTPLATNRGFAEARGEYVYGLSADDFVLPGFFEHHMAALEANREAGLSYGDFVTVTQGREILERTPSLPPHAGLYPPDALSDALYGDILEARGAIFRRDALLDAGGLIPELEEMSDWYLGLAVAFRHGLYYVPGPCHAKRVDFTSYALKRQADRRGQQEKIRRIARLLESECNSDLVPHFVRSAAFMHFGDDAAQAFIAEPDEWTPTRRALLQEPVAEYMRRKRERARSSGRMRNRPHFSRPATWQKYVADYTPEYLRPKIASLVDEWRRDRKRVLVYGAGEHTVALFKLTSLRDAHVVGIADRSPGLQGERQWGLEVVAPSEIPSLRPDVVLISSAANQDEIAAHLVYLEGMGIEVVTLYGDGDVARGSTTSAVDRERAAFERGAMIQRVRELVARWNREHRRVVLYGAGEETSQLFKCTDLANANLVAIAESVSLLQGERLWGLYTIAPEAIETLEADTVLICRPDPRGEIRSFLEPLERRGFEVASLSDSSGPRVRDVKPTRVAPSPPSATS
jgi:glycosyltransferase involved in cell wall biosynthesis